MSFLEIQFPANISRNAVGGPKFQTDIGIVDSGLEYRNQSWVNARGEWDVSHAARTQAQYEQLMAFFLSLKGRTHGFRFKDWADFTATGSQGVFVALSGTTFQMYRRFTFGSLTYDHKIVKPIATSITVTGGTTPTVSGTTGVVSVASGTPTAWVGEYDKACRFGTDSMQGEIIDGPPANRIIGWQSIQIIETREYL